MPNSDTPKTDAAIDSRIGFHVVSANFARQLERELNEAKRWKDEDPRMLREQIRVADSAYNTLHSTVAGLITDRDQWKQCAEELARAFHNYPNVPSHDKCLAALSIFNKLKES